MWDAFRTLYNPASYQSHRRRPPFFEGWYIKLVDLSQKHRLALIPGVHVGKTAAESHAFVQVFDGVSGESFYHRYPLQEFWAAVGSFDVRVGPNSFSAFGAVLDIDRPEQRVRGELYFPINTPWPVTLLSPGWMGPYAFAPGVACYHDVVSLDHPVRGWLNMGRRDIDFNDGRGYIEKDWGRAFPRARVWMQTNHFDQPGVSLTASASRAPGALGAFRGFGVGLWLRDRLYRFTAYTGARIERLQVFDDRVEWRVSDADHRLEMVAWRCEGRAPGAPTPASADRRITAPLTARVETRLWHRKRLIFDGEGEHAGLEIVGSV